MSILSLTYHDVVQGPEFQESSGFEGPGANIYKLDEPLFERHLEAIQRASTGRACREVLTAPDALGSVGRKALLLHFDDGGGSAMRTAAILEDRGWRGHFHITTGCIGQARFLAAREIRSLRQRGHIIGSHSDSHPTRMSALSMQSIREEWQRSVAKLSDILGEPIAIGSLPGGYYQTRVAIAAAEAGIKILFTSEPTTRARVVDGCLVLGRYSIQRATRVERVAALAEGRWKPRAGQWLWWNTKKGMKLVGGPLWLQARAYILRQRSRR